MFVAVHNSRRQARENAPRPRHVDARALRKRRGMAVSELAICIPVLVVIVFGSIQMCNVIYLKHAMVTAAYEGSLEIAKSITSNDAVETRVRQVLEARRISNATIEILPAGADVAATPHGQTLLISINAQTPSNLSVTGFVTAPATMTHTITCSR
mgnify:CR=1 FL=1